MSATVRARRSALAPAVGELRRVRAELAAMTADRDEWKARALALLDATDHDGGAAWWARYGAQLGEQERAAAEAAGYARAVAEFKAGWHEIVAAVHLAGIRRGPGGPAWLAAVQRNGATEYGGQDRPRVPVPADVIAEARREVTR